MVMKIILKIKIQIENRDIYKDIKMSKQKDSGDLTKIIYIGLLFGQDGFYGINLLYLNQQKMLVNKWE